MDAMSRGLAQNWWVIALRGVFATLFGIVTIALPGAAIASLVLLFAAYMLADGILAIIAGARAARQGERWSWLILEGIADILAGAVALLWPVVTVLFFVYLMSAWAIISGAMLVLAAFRLNIDHSRWLMLAGGIVSVIWGILLLLWPFVGALVLTWWMGGYALFFGAALIALAYRLRRHRQRLVGGNVAKGHKMARTGG
jgi:uncharacterized membrane protein HdeD (DUF308 family)